MNYNFINNKWLYSLVFITSLPLIMMGILSFISNDGSSNLISFSGYSELFNSLRLGEILTIAKRALIVSIISTILAFGVSYLLFSYASILFQTIFYILITLPFVINESIRVFSWQYILAENGVLNNALSFITGSSVVVFNGSNSWNIPILMIFTCTPFAIFICSAALRIIPQIYWNAARDLGLSTFGRLIKIAIPLCGYALFASMIVVFFIAFSLSSEVNFLGGDTKISLRNLILSLMSASKFQSIFSLGFLMLIVLGIGYLLVKFINKNNKYSEI